MPRKKQYSKKNNKFGLTPEELKERMHWTFFNSL